MRREQGIDGRAARRVRVRNTALPRLLKHDGLRPTRDDELSPRGGRLIVVQALPRTRPALRLGLPPFRLAGQQQIQPSANDDLPLPLRPTTIVRPGRADSFSVAAFRMPRKPSTVNERK